MTEDMWFAAPILLLLAAILVGSYLRLAILCVRALRGRR